MDSTMEIFEMIKDHCREKMPTGPYTLWIKDIVCEKLDDKSAVLMVTTNLRKQIIESKYYDFLKDAFEEVLGFHVDIKVESLENKRAAEAAAAANYVERDPVSIDFASGSNSEYTFATFIVGASNKFAHAASLAVATNPASSYNPLFIYGESGLGKTHLLNAICAETASRNPNFKITYVKGEDFTNELITAIQTETTKEFHDKYRQSDVLLVDDIQFIGGRERTQEEFFHTFNALYESNKQIVLASDRPPREMKALEDRLRSRFESGLLADIQPPDYETRVAILRRKAEQLNIVIPDEVTEYIANKLKTNIRQLEGTVKRIKAFHSLAGTAPSIAIAQNAIRDILNDSQPVSVTVDRIINEVSRYFEVSVKDIRSADRTAAVSSARQAAMYIIREITQLSMEKIGAEFSDRDHATVVYTLKKVDKKMKTNAHFKNTVEAIIKNVRDN
ncbi:MAG: chromosomal replication initiator protein DnaA [Oscillospiraceae bacterium]|nr:chromosomal replication initiator protein DnaA [Oscillospiraceae bacterium]